MTTEIEVKFINIDKDEVRAKLEEIGAKLVQPERLMRRWVGGHDYRDGRWLRLRDEGDKVTLTFKDRTGRSIDSTKELETTVSDFDTVYEILLATDVPFHGYQENTRESWLMGDVQVEIDTWPGLNPYIEIEADSKQKVMTVAEQLGFDWSEARFETSDELFAEQHEISQEEAFAHFDDIRFEQFED